MVSSHGHTSVLLTSQSHRCVSDAFVSPPQPQLFVRPNGPSSRSGRPTSYPSRPSLSTLKQLQLRSLGCLCLARAWSQYAAPAAPLRLTCEFRRFWSSQRAYRWHQHLSWGCLDRPFALLAQSQSCLGLRARSDAAQAVSGIRQVRVTLLLFAQLDYQSSSVREDLLEAQPSQKFLRFNCCLDRGAEVQSDGPSASLKLTYSCAMIRIRGLRSLRRTPAGSQ